MTVHCRLCGHKWNVPVVVPSKLSTFCATLKRAADEGCPKCHADASNVLCGAKVS